MEERTREKLCHHYDTIAKELDTDHVTLYLSGTVLTPYECDKIASFKIRQDRAAYLLDIVTNKGPLAYHHFRYALQDRYPHLVKKLDEVCPSPRAKCASEQSERSKFRRRDSLILNLKTDGVLEFLERGGVLSQGDRNTVRAGKTSEDKARVLVNMVAERDDATYRQFRLAVKAHQPKLAEMLE